MSPSDLPVTVRVVPDNVAFTVLGFASFVNVSVPLAKTDVTLDELAGGGGGGGGGVPPPSTAPIQVPQSFVAVFLANML